MNMLIVEDNDMLATLLEIALEPIAKHVYVAKSWADAEKRLIDHREINVVLLDLSLPDSSVSETTEHLRNLKLAADSPIVIVMTGHWSEDVASKIVAAGANGYVEKSRILELAPKIVGAIVRRGLNMESSSNELEHLLTAPPTAFA